MLPSVLEEAQLQLHLITLPWFMCLFVNTLRPEIALRVWDMFLCEGNKVLFRISVALIKLYESKILATRDSTELFTLMKDIGKDVVDPDTLIALAYKSFNPVSSRPRKKQGNPRLGKSSAKKNAVPADLTGIGLAHCGPERSAASESRSQSPLVRTDASIESAGQRPYLEPSSSSSQQDVPTHLRPSSPLTYLASYLPLSLNLSSIVRAVSPTTAESINTVPDSTLPDETARSSSAAAAVAALNDLSTSPPLTPVASAAAFEACVTESDDANVSVEADADEDADVEVEEVEDNDEEFLSESALSSIPSATPRFISASDVELDEVSPRSVQSNPIFRPFLFDRKPKPKPASHSEKARPPPHPSSSSSSSSSSNNNSDRLREGSSIRRQILRNFLESGGRRLRVNKHCEFRRADNDVWRAEVRRDMELRYEEMEKARSESRSLSSDGSLASLGKEPVVVVVAAATATADNSFDEYCCGDDEEISPAASMSTLEGHKLGADATTGSAGADVEGRKEEATKLCGDDG